MFEQALQSIKSENDDFDQVLYAIDTILKALENTDAFASKSIIYNKIMVVPLM